MSAGFFSTRPPAPPRNHIHRTARCVNLSAVMKNSPVFRPAFLLVLVSKSLLPALLICAPAISARAVAQAPLPDSPAIEAQARALLSKLTLEQKITLIGGNPATMGTQPMPSIGLPSLRMSDGPVGVRTWADYCVSLRRFAGRQLGPRAGAP